MTLNKVTNFFVNSADLYKEVSKGRYFRSKEGRTGIIDQNYCQDNVKIRPDLVVSNPCGHL